MIGGLEGDVAIMFVFVDVYVFVVLYCWVGEEISDGFSYVGFVEVCEHAFDVEGCVFDVHVGFFE